LTSGTSGIQKARSLFFNSNPLGLPQFPLTFPGFPPLLCAVHSRVAFVCGSHAVTRQQQQQQQQQQQEEEKQ